MAKIGGGKIPFESRAGRGVISSGWITTACIAMGEVGICSQGLGKAALAL